MSSYPPQQTLCVGYDQFDKTDSSNIWVSSSAQCWSRGGGGGALSIYIGGGVPQHIQKEGS